MNHFWMTTLLCRGRPSGYGLLTMTVYQALAYLGDVDSLGVRDVDTLNASRW